MDSRPDADAGELLAVHAGDRAALAAAGYPEPVEPSVEGLLARDAPRRALRRRALERCSMLLLVLRWLRAGGCRGGRFPGPPGRR